MHLTNYAINKESKDYKIDTDGVTHKRSLEEIWTSLEEIYESARIEEVKSEIDSIIMKTILSAYNKLSNCYKKHVKEECIDSICFEILGFDILLDRGLKPWLIEVNHAPSFATETKFDQELKQGLVLDTLKLINLTPLKKQKYKEWAKERRG